MPDALRVSASANPDAVIALVHYDTGTIYELSLTRKHFIAGSAPDRDVDIAIDSPFVSARHCRFDRRFLGLRVTDLNSKNGVYFEGDREKGFYLRPGKAFVIGALPHRFLALNSEMRRSYPILIDILGEPKEYAVRDETPSPSDMILAGVGGAHLLIVGEPHCGQADLARIVHAISRRCDKPIVELAQIPIERPQQLELARRRAGRSTLVVDLGDDDSRVPSSFLKTVFSQRYQVRVIVLARSYDVAHRAFGETYVRHMQQIWIPPVASRPEAIDRLLDRRFMERKSAFRMSQMTLKNQDALRAHAWPDNFASLDEAADRLEAISRSSTNKAAQELGIKPTTLYHWYSETMGLSRPLVPDAP